MTERVATLANLVCDELGQPVDPRVKDMALAIAKRHAAASTGVLFYGSCLRQAELDGLMLDFYLVVSDYRAAYDAGWMALLNRLLPPNVFPFEFKGLMAKYAVLSESDFDRLCSSRTRNVSVWARFAQPSRLVWYKDEPARRRLLDAVCEAAPALLSAARPMLPDVVSPLELWRGSFALTYGAELRAERSGRALSVVDSEPARYERFTAPALAAAGIVLDAPVEFSRRRQSRLAWKRRKIEGKTLTILRLVKASLTYAGGIDYLAWKINRHAGAAIVIKPWQRRWPIIGALTLLPRLLRGGAVH
jgi:hypothetical protein